MTPCKVVYGCCALGFKDITLPIPLGEHVTPKTGNEQQIEDQRILRSTGGRTTSKPIPKE